MMISGVNNPCYPNGPPYGIAGDDQEPVIPPPENGESSQPPASFLYNLSILKDKVHQVQSLAAIFLPSDHSPQESTAAFAVPTMGTLIQEIILTASSMAFACQQMSLGSTTEPAFDHQVASGGRNRNHNDHNKACHQERPLPGFFSDDHPMLDQLYNTMLPPQKREASEGFSDDLSSFNYDIIELAASDLLAKYTHYCQVCGKGFKRDANLRMHMRAHGDEYKSSAALSNPIKGGSTTGMQKYSCPQEGCRWNKNHAKFQPLKSMICVKNHYKRSHCPKMYVCKRCNRKQFSVLSDLRTHEKHCGDIKWRCSCGTTFSRKDKLMGHISLFIGHTPATNSSTKMGITCGNR